MGWTRNIGVNGFSFGLVNRSNGTPITSGEVSGFIKKDGETQTTITDTPVSQGNGLWAIDLTEEEMNAELVSLAFIHSLAVPVYYMIKTESDGVNQLSITVVNYNIGIPEVNVYVYNSTNTIFVASGSTDSDGKVIFYLQAGTYNIRLKRFGSIFTNPNQIVITEDTEVEYEGTPILITTPADSEMCRVYEYCYDQTGGLPLASVVAKATIVKYPFDSDGKTISIIPVNGTYNSTTGLVYWDIVKGAEALIKIKETGYNKTVIIPNADTVRLIGL